MPTLQEGENREISGSVGVGFRVWASAGQGRDGQPERGGLAGGGAGVEAGGIGRRRHRSGRRSAREGGSIAGKWGSG